MFYVPCLLLHVISYGLICIHSGARVLYLLCCQHFLNRIHCLFGIQTLEILQRKLQIEPNKMAFIAGYTCVLNTALEYLGETAVVPPHTKGSVLFLHGCQDPGFHDGVLL